MIVTITQESRVGFEALSARRTGSCRRDEKAVRAAWAAALELAVSSPHPAAATEAGFAELILHIEYLPCSDGVTAKEVFLCLM